MIDFESKYTGEEVEALLDAVNGKQNNIEDLDEIRSGAAAGATALQSVPSEYVTETELKDKGYATMSALEDKVDKVTGKQLSTEDFTTYLKEKLEGLSNYNDAEISAAVSSLQIQLDYLVSGNANDAINSFNEIIAFLDGVQDTQDLEGIIAAIEQQIAGKMDKVTLATVATSGSYNDLSNKPTIPAEQVNADWNATSGKAQILNKPTIPSAVTESTVSGWGFTKNTGTYSKPSGGIPASDLASDVQLSLSKANDALQEQRADENYIKKNIWDDITVAMTDGFFSDVAGLHFALPNTNNGDEDDVLLSRESVKTINGESILGSGDIDTKPYVTNFSYEELESIGHKQTGIQNELIYALREQRPILVPMSLTSDLGYYHASGYIEDLMYLTIYGDYGVVYYLEVDYTNSLELNPNNVIRKEFQNKLNSGTNIKTINGENILGSGDITISGGGGGTITGVSANGTSIATSGVANIPAASTSAYGVTKLSSATNSTSTTLAATASAVKSAYDLANSYKGTVTGVKINGTTKSPTSGTVDLGTVITSHQDISGKQDTLVSGTNIKTINGTSILGSGDITISGGSSSSGKEYVEAPLMTEPMGTSIFFNTAVPLEPNKVYVAKKKVSAINTSSMSIPSDSIGAEYTIMFQTSTSELQISVSSASLLWVNGAIPTIEADTYYELSLVFNNINNTKILKAVLTPFKPVE